MTDKIEDKRGIRKNLFLCILTIIFGILINVGLTIILPYISTSGFQSSSKVLLDGSFVVRFLASGITIPILEEFLFRGLITGYLDKKLPRFFAVILGSCLFGLFHFNLVQFIYAFLVGIFLSYGYLLSKTLKVPVISHITINSVVLIYSAIYGG